MLTKFVVSQALEELLDQNDTRTTPEEILQLTICEPALGSGAFAIEAVRQLAAEYLTRKQHDLDKRIEPDRYPVELQKVKAHIALHQVYGVDLNATAVELAEISLWLDTMVAGLQAPGSACTCAAATPSSAPDGLCTNRPISRRKPG